MLRNEQRGHGQNLAGFQTGVTPPPAGGGTVKLATLRRCCPNSFAKREHRKASVHLKLSVGLREACRAPTLQ